METIGKLSEDGKYYFPVNITDADVDVCDNWKYSAMLSAMQEAGAIHTELCGASRERLVREFGISYVVVRMHIEMNRLPGEHEHIQIATWNNGESKLILPRYYEMYDEHGNEIGRAASQWMLLNLNNRKIIHPTREILSDSSAKLLESGKLAAPINVLLPKSPEMLRQLTSKESDFTQIDAKTVKNRKPMFSDMDHNGHVNNARYAEWVMDALPDDLMITKRREIRMLDITYKREITAAAVISGEITDITTESIVSGNDFAMIARANGVNETFNAIEVFGSLN